MLLPNYPACSPHPTLLRSYVSVCYFQDGCNHLHFEGPVAAQDTATDTLDFMWSQGLLSLDREVVVGSEEARLLQENWGEIGPFHECCGQHFQTLDPKGKAAGEEEEIPVLMQSKLEQGVLETVHNANKKKPDVLGGSLPKEGSWI